jgi:hypothetical protein
MTYNTLGEAVAVLLKSLTATHRALRLSSLPFMVTRSSARAARACRDAAWHEWCVRFWMDQEDSTDFAVDEEGKPFRRSLKWYDVDPSGEPNRREKNWTPEMALWKTNDWARAIVDAEQRQYAVERSQRDLSQPVRGRGPSYTNAHNAEDVKAIAEQWDAEYEHSKKEWEAYETQLEGFRAAGREASQMYFRAFDAAEEHVRESQARSNVAGLGERLAMNQLASRSEP